MTIYYAELDKNNICVGIIENAKPEKFIVIDSWDLSVVGKKWHNDSRTWEAVPEPPKMILSKNEFRQRLTKQEKLKLDSPELFSQVFDPLSPLQILTLRSAREEIATSDEINFTSESFVSNMLALEAVAVIDKGRVAEIIGISEAELIAMLMAELGITESQFNSMMSAMKDGKL